MMRWLWIVIALAVVAAGAGYFWPRGQAGAPIVQTTAAPVPAPMQMTVPLTSVAPTPSEKPNVAIQEGKTIDFSSGHPVVRDTVDDKAAMEAALKEMEDAAKDITFGPTEKK